MRTITVACCFLFATLAQASPGAKIVGGALAKSGQFPYHVGLVTGHDHGLAGEGHSGHFCNGALIAPNVILTAAHCLNTSLHYDAHMGAINISDMHAPGHVHGHVLTLQVHEGFDPVTRANDLALATLETPVEASDVIDIIRLPSRSQAKESFVGAKATVTGWGKESEDDEHRSELLKFVEMSVMENDACATDMGADVTAETICVDSEGGTVGICHGDCGGPLVVIENDGKPTEVGVASYGFSAGCTSGKPGAFVRLTDYLDWIEDNSGVGIRP